MHHDGEASHKYKCKFIFSLSLALCLMRLPKNVRIAHNGAERFIPVKRVMHGTHKDCRRAGDFR